LVHRAQSAASPHRSSTLRPMKPAGKVSSIGDILPENRRAFLATANWKTAYDETHAPKHCSETRAAMFSTMRAKAARDAALEVLTKSPSLVEVHPGVALRKSQINFGFERPADAEALLRARRQTETKESYVAQPLPILQTAEENKEKQATLQKSHIDLAFGVEKTGRNWGTDMAEKMAANTDLKYVPERAAPIDGKRNYKSMVPFGDNGLVFGESEARVTESKAQYADPGNPARAHNYAATLGKELRQHSWDNAMGRDKTTDYWMSAQSAAMGRNAYEKFDCCKPQVDPRLSKQLRQSTIFLGGEKADWPAQGMQRALSMPGLAGPLGSGSSYRLC